MSRAIGVGIVALLFLFVVGAPPIVGIVMERRILSGVEEAAERGQRIELEYDRGLYRSNVRTIVGVVPGEGEDAVQVVVDHVLVHGPIPLAATSIGRSPLDLVVALVQSTVDADPADMPDIAVALDGQALAQADTRIGPSFDIDVDFVAPPFSLDEDAFTWRGATGEIHVRDAGDSVTAGLESPGLEAQSDGDSIEFAAFESTYQLDVPGDRFSGRFTSGGGSLRVEGMQYLMGPMTGDFSRGIEGGQLAAGESNLTVVELSSRDALGQPGFVLSEILLSQTAGLVPDTGFYGSKATLRFGTWKVGDQVPDGPGGLDVNIDRFDAEAIVAFQAAMNELEASGLSDEELESVRMFTAMEKLPALLASSPEVSVTNVTLDGPNGALTGAMSLGVDGSDPSMLGDPFMLISQVKAVATLDASEPLLRRLVETLMPPAVADPIVDPLVMGGLKSDMAAQEVIVDRVDGWIQQGFLVRQNGRLTMDARFESGFPMLNGQPADPSFLMNLMPGM